MCKHLHGTDSIRQEVLLQDLFLMESDIIYGSVISSQVLNQYEAGVSPLDRTY